MKSQNPIGPDQWPDIDERAAKLAEQMKHYAEASKFHAEATKHLADARSAAPGMLLIKYVVAGIIAGITCILLYFNVNKQLYEFASERLENSEKAMTEAEKKAADAEKTRIVVSTDLGRLREESGLLTAQIESFKTQEETRNGVLADLEKQISDSQLILEEFRTQLESERKNSQLTARQKADLESRLGLVEAALESARKTIPASSNQTLGYLRIGQMDPRGAWLSGNRAVESTPALQDLRVGDRFQMGEKAYVVRSLLPRNDDSYFGGVTVADRLFPGNEFEITEPPTVYWRKTELDVWVGVRKLATGSPLPAADDLPSSSEELTLDPEQEVNPTPGNAQP